MPLMPQPGRETIIGIPYLHDPGDVFLIRFPPRYRKEDQVFSYTPAGEATLHIHIGKVYRKLDAGKIPRRLNEYAVVHAQAQWIARHHGVETPHLARIADTYMEREPGLLLAFDNNSHAIIDGSHRYLVRYMKKQKFMEFFEVTMTDIRDCLLDLPQDFGLEPDQRGWGDRKDMAGMTLGPDGSFRRKP